MRVGKLLWQKIISRKVFRKGKISQIEEENTVLGFPSPL
jgi:hypothetical protein